MTISFPGLHEDIEVDQYRVYMLELLPGDHLVAFGAYY